MGFAHQVAAAIIVFTEAQLADGRAPVAELVESARHLNVVGRQGPVRLGTELGHHQERNPLDPRRGPLDPGQQQVDDVVHAVVVAGRYKYLLAPQQVIPVVSGFGHSAKVRQGAAGLGFGQGHGALPLSGVHAGDVGFLKGFGAEGFDQVGRPGGQQGIDAGRVIGGGKNKTGDGPDQQGQLLAAVLIRGQGGDPAALPAGPHPVPDHGVDFDLPLDELGRVLVHLPQQGLQDIPTQFEGRIQNQIEDLPAVFGVIFVLGQGFRVKDLVKHEFQIAFADEFFGHV